jgi:phosphomannomutase
LHQIYEKEKNMGKYFGTDGFRGEAGITLTADHAYKVGRFLGWYYNTLRERNGDILGAVAPYAAL